MANGSTLSSSETGMLTQKRNRICQLLSLSILRLDWSQSLSQLSSRSSWMLPKKRRIREESMRLAWPRKSSRRRRQG